MGSEKDNRRTASPSTKRWLLAALAVVVAPKCGLCGAGYLAAGGAIVELCGDAPADHSVVWLIGVALGVGMLLLGWRRSRKTHEAVSGRGEAVR